MVRCGEVKMTIFICFTPLHFAVTNGRFDVVAKVFLEQEAKVQKVSGR